MARNTTTIDATPEQVFDTLMDPDVYAEWVVGSKEVRGADDDWPAVGARFHHTQGVGPVEIRDYTEIEVLERPERLVLLARARPAVESRVDLRFRSVEGGTEVEMLEETVGGAGDAVPSVLTDPALFGRNTESLRRLRSIVEERVGRGA